MFESRFEEGLDMLFNLVVLNVVRFLFCFIKFGVLKKGMSRPLNEDFYCVVLSLIF